MGYRSLNSVGDAKHFAVRLFGLPAFAITGVRTVKTVGRLMRVVVTAIFFIQFVGCSLDYSDAYVSDDMSEDIPDSVFENFRYTSIKEGSPAFLIEGDKAEFFVNKEETYLTNVRFTEYGSDGDVATEGRADSAVYFTGTENAEIEGNLRFYSSTESATVTAEYLYWDNQEKRLRGSNDGTVSVREDSGSRIQGVGFEADVRRKEVMFSGSVTGRYVPEEQNE